MRDNSTERMMKHYSDEAEKWGASSASTMEDEIVRQRETDLISDFVGSFWHNSILDVGCGNGYTLSKINKYNTYYGIDVSKELIDIAERRGLHNCSFRIQNACNMSDFKDGIFDAVYTQRCLINILTWEDKLKALDEIHRVLTINGSYLMIECFTDGLENQNRARIECGLPELKAVYHNVYFEKQQLFEAIKDKFVVTEPYCGHNFLSSHYFVARVLHALVTKKGQVKNTEFVKFFSYLPPIGEYSQIQAYVLRKI